MAYVHAADFRFPRNQFVSFKDATAIVHLYLVTGTTIALPGGAARHLYLITNVDKSMTEAIWEKTGTEVAFYVGELLVASSSGRDSNRAGAPAYASATGPDDASSSVLSRPLSPDPDRYRLPRGLPLAARGAGLRPLGALHVPHRVPGHPRRLPVRRRRHDQSHGLPLHPPQPVAAPLHGQRRGAPARHPHPRRSGIPGGRLPRDGEHPHPGEERHRRPARADQSPPRVQRADHGRHPGRHRRDGRRRDHRVLQQLFHRAGEPHDGVPQGDPPAGRHGELASPCAAPRRWKRSSASRRTRWSRD